MTDVAPPSTIRTIRLVAAREFTTRVKTKAFAISVAVILVVIVGGQIAVAAFTGDDDARAVAVVGADSSLASALTASGQALEEPVEVIEAPDEASAREKVVDGEVEAAVVTRPDGAFRVVSDDELDATLRAVVTAATRQVALDNALAAQDVDTERFNQDVARATLSIDVLDPADPDRRQRTTLAYIAVFLLFFTVYLYGLYVAMGVVEEKSSKVVELLLSTIRPIDLLLGKVFGIGAVGLVQVLLFGGVALVTGLLTDLVTVQSTAVTLFGFVVLWYVLGFAFFALLYAALGSLVSRQEDVNSSTMPLSILAFATFFTAQSALSDPSSGWIGVLAWIPPFSSTIMPLRLAAGVASPVEVVATVVVMLAAIAVAAWFAARIYENSVLNTGGRQSLRGALRQ